MVDDDDDSILMEKEDLEIGIYSFWFARTTWCDITIGLHSSASA